MSRDPKEQLYSAVEAISIAASVLKIEMPTFEAFLKEARDMENFGHIVDPTLFKDSERRAVNAVVEPLFKAAQTFVHAYDAHVARASTVLAAVQEARSA